MDGTAGKVLMHIIRRILFGDGRPRYGQSPPLGGILLQDALTAGALVSLNCIYVHLIVMICF